MIKTIAYLASQLGIENKTLLEKDIFLHTLLSEIVGNDYLRDNLVFKGGTCLIKCYLGYYRFSEDLDFSWINQKEFEKKSQKEIRKNLSVKINEIISIMEKIAKKINLDFEANKSDRKYVEIGGSNKFLTLKLWYTSSILNSEQFIKIQINFLEIFQYHFMKRRAKSLLRDIDSKEFSFLFPEYSKSLLAFPEITCYDIKEILVEKLRAILTRRGVKARDFIDIFLIVRKQGFSLRSFKGRILEKTSFMLRYDEYIQSLKDFNLEKLVFGEEEKLMLVPIGEGYREFLAEARPFLVELADELKNRNVRNRHSQSPRFS